ncbi:MAG: response regulator [Candidatus Tenebribacter davisii]|jgi:DNA-binding NtrC family response regulator|nr:response regulator [Candidatus Tenebribacter davisii]
MCQRILIVDDDVSITKYLKLELEENLPELEIICENKGYLALNVIMSDGIDLLLTDIAMPDMDGYELYSRTKEFDENLPVIMMTGFGYDPDHIVVKSKQAGLHDVIFKPFDIKKLTKMIKDRIKRRLIRSS